jgi:hypothetical protein
MPTTRAPRRASQAETYAVPQPFPPDHLHLVAFVEHEPFTRYHEIRIAEVHSRDRDR